ncbi:MAG: hypothetical protein QF472_02990 [Candidatus Marinimicrobia bacterium]|jgi:hypothetical protein|nr:hypothetical protein [Candidatus Neomarinimicrobiota bacterium]MDP6852898.1 hypothetical protein [Candidatus Neomarinimicrobiota bacterium]
MGSGIIQVWYFGINLVISRRGILGICQDVEKGENGIAYVKKEN